MTTIKQLTSALNTLADFMNEPGKIWDSALREEVDGNILHYPQKRILNGIAFAAVTSLQFAEAKADEQRGKVRELLRSHRNDEISERKANQAMDYLDRLNLQVTALDAFATEAMEAYQRHTGECFVAPKQKPQTDAKFQSAAMERAAKYGIIDTELTLGGGIDAAAA